jgi:hypothetical protein
MTRIAYRLGSLLLIIAFLAPGGSRAEEYGIGDLHLRLPEGFQRISFEKETIPSPVPGAEPTREYSARFRSKDGHTLFLLTWRGDFPRDRGPMKAAWSRRVTVAGHPCDLVRTSLFMGKRQSLHALFCSFSGRGGFLLYSPDLPPDRFRTLFAGISLNPD